MHEGPTALELTERCLRREKLLETTPAADPIAATAGGGALLTRVGGDARPGRDRLLGGGGRSARGGVPADRAPDRPAPRRPRPRPLRLGAGPAPVADAAPDPVRLLVPVTAAATLPGRGRRALHLRGTARRHRERVLPCRRDDRRRRPRPARPRALPRRPPGARPAGRRPGVRGRPRGARPGPRRHPRRAPHRPRPGDRLGVPGRAGAGARAGAAARGVPHDGGQVPRTRVLRRARDPEPAHLAARRRPGRRALPAARQGARGVRLAPHLSGGRRGAARLPPRHDARRLDGAGGLPRGGVLDRRLLRRRRPLPQRDPALDDPVEGRRVDQGPVAPGRRADRARRPRRRDDRHRRPGERPVLPRAGRLATGDRRQPALRRRVPAAARGRAAAIRSSRSRSPAASAPSRGSATSAPAS